MSRHAKSGERDHYRDSDEATHYLRVRSPRRGRQPRLTLQQLRRPPADPVERRFGDNGRPQGNRGTSVSREAQVAPVRPSYIGDMALKPSNCSFPGAEITPDDKQIRTRPMLASRRAEPREVVGVSRGQVAAEASDGPA